MAESSEIDYSKISEETKKSLEKFKEIANKDIVKDVVNGAKSSIKYMAIGTGVGVIIALIYRKRVLPYAIGFGLIGGFTGKFINSVKNKENV